MVERELEDWFQRMVVERLKDLAEGQKAIEVSQAAMHAANQTKVDEVVSAVNEIKLEVHSFKIVRQVVFAGIASILLAILATVLALVLKTGKVL